MKTRYIVGLFLVGASVLSSCSDFTEIDQKGMNLLSTTCLLYTSFLRDLSWMDFLKLRFSYGVTGNIYQGATSHMTASSGDINSTTNLPVASISSPDVYKRHGYGSMREIRAHKP